MENSKFTKGQSVTSKRFGARIVTEFDGKKVSVDFNGEVKTMITAYAGLQAGTEVVTKADEYKARKAKKSAKAAAAQPKTTADFIKVNATLLLMVCKPSRRQVWEGVANEVGAKAVELNNEFVQSVLDSAAKNQYMSEAQAYAVAKWAFENGITL